MTDAQKRLEKLKSIIEGNAVNTVQPSQISKPLLSIVTIYDEYNEAKWMYDFLQNLPTFELGKVELILCKTIKDSNAQVEPKESVIINGIQVHYCAVFFDNFSFSDARNAAKSMAKGEWILSLDTDEMLIQNQMEKLFEWIQNADSDVGAIGVRIYSLVGESDAFDISPPCARLFRNDPHIMWQCAIHESVMFSVFQYGFKRIDSNITIFHGGYDTDVETLKKKLHRNLKMMCHEYGRIHNTMIEAHLEFHLLKTINEIERLKNGDYSKT